MTAFILISLGVIAAVGLVCALSALRAERKERR